ncbi:MAG TPA: hypothetical protein VFS45_03945 [Sphingomicrobium sp.]|nr:hypothetical protein [Sphingomicrobium sp.]
MHKVVRSNLYTRLSGSLRLPSVAGKGLPERMRTTAFAFLGLTAALGLALVAVFAQLSFSVLSPAPAPSGPDRSAVSEAVSLKRQPVAVALTPRREATGTVDGAVAGGTRGSGRHAEPAGAPPPSPEPAGSGGVPAQPVDSAPAPAPSPKPAPEQPAPSAGQPGASAPSKPESTPARPAAPEPEPAPAPGNSHSTAAAEHASERGIEASSKSSTAAVAPEAEPDDSPGKGNGKALGHDK